MPRYFLRLTVIVCCVWLAQCGKKNKGSNKSKASDDSVCYDDVDDPYIYFATKTAYRFNRNENDDEIKHEGCSPRQFWLLNRHGTRNPGTEDMVELQSKLPVMVESIVANHQAGRGSLCEDDLENLQEWKFGANITEDKFLVKEGYKELKDLGDRFQERFPSLLTKPFVNESYIFQFTDSERTEASAQAFARGMFGKKDAPNVHYRKSPKRDVLLRFYKSCPKWKQEVDDNPAAITEKTKYEESGEFKSMIQNVTRRLGFAAPLKLEDVDFMYSMCSFDKAWRPKKLSPWCAAFNESDLEILEYREDLEYYYEDGYGFPINYHQACPTVKDAFDHFRAVVDDSASHPRGIFYFTHSGTLLKVLARFGLFEDAVPLQHSNRKEMANRQWRTSLIDSFASNLALVLFKCNDGHRVASYVQERPVQLPGCTDMLCHFDQFSAKYGPIAESCSLDDICRI